MNNFKKKIQGLGSVEGFEVKSHSFLLFLIGPTLFIYSYFINNYGDETLRIEGAREVSALLFLIASILPFIFKKTINSFYGWIVFLLMLGFTHYLIINLHLNNFSIRFILGFYAVVFGSIILFSTRIFVNIYFVTVYAHLFQKLMISEVDDVTYKTILSSFSLIFIFGMILLNNTTRYREFLYRNNKSLEKGKIKSTLDLKKRAKDLEEKNEDLEDFAHVVSHDLKTPLRNILALSNWARDDVRNNNMTSLNENLTLLEMQIVKMDSIVEGVLNYSLQSTVSSSYEEVDTDRLIKDFILLNKKNNCTITVKKRLPFVKINKSQMGQVFQNLIQNAIKYNNQDVCEIEIDFTQDKNFYTFSVKDNGIGIDSKYHEKIFELFQKLEIKKGVDSTGIGLSLVKKIISRNKGKIYLESKVNKGTTFYFTLPI